MSWRQGGNTSISVTRSGFKSGFDTNVLHGLDLVVLTFLNFNFLLCTLGEGLGSIVFKVFFQSNLE